ncbi:MAG: beta-N-acetylglucosaminidase domain-containing protein [Pseudomonadota bacterium]
MLLLLLLFAGCRPAPDCACPGCAGEPRDLLPEARLEVDDIRPAEGHPWAREDEAGPAALRNDLPDDGWQPPDTTPAWLEIDLQPRLGVAILESLEATWTGAVPAVEVAILPGCGLEPTAVLPWDDSTVPLDLTGHCAGCLRLTVEGGADSTLTALTLMGEAGFPPNFVYDDGSAPPPRFPGSGLIEGFYGQPWSWRERRSAVEVLHRAFLGLYLYAPKDDPYHRDRWREPYDILSQEAFADLAVRAGVVGVDLVFGISPFLDYDPDDPDDYATLLDKLDSMADLGVQGVALLADDIELEADVTVDGDLGAMQVEVANRLRDDMRAAHPGLDFWFVPTVYGDDRLAEWEGAPAYLEALQALHPGYEVMWTGTGTFAATLTAADLDTVRSLIGRDPVLWDNLWANDIYDPFSGRVHLGVYSGRSADLSGVVAGVGANPMVQGALSRLDLGLLNAWERTGDAADPRLMAASVESSDEGDQALLVQVMRAFDGTALALPGHPDLPDADPVADLDTLLPLLASLAALPSAVHHSALEPDLVDELVYPLDKVRHEALAGLWSLTVASERLAGREGTPAAAAAEAALDLSADSRFVWSPGAVEDLLDAALEVEMRAAGLGAPVALPPAPLPCAVGATSAWRPFGGASDVAVFGLPGASTRGDLISWQPPHPGAWTAVAIARSPGGGWVWLERDLSCEPG